MSLRIALATATPHDRCETFVAEQIKRLDKVVLVLTDGYPPQRDAQGMPLLGSDPIERAKDRWRSTVLRQDLTIRLTARIAELLRKQRIDVVLAHYGGTAQALVDACGMAGVPLVAHFHGFDAFKTDALERSAGYKKLFASARGIVAVSSAMAQQLISLGAAPERLLNNSCGVDADRFTPGNPAEAPARFISVGRFVEKKAPILVLAAFQRVLRERPAATLVMVGDGPLWECCRQFARTEGLRESVTLVGARSQDEVAAMLRTARAYVQHSVSALNGDSEGTPVALLEAMAAALPIVATSHMGIAEVVEHDVSGLLCEEHDVVTMAAHMITLVDEPQRAASMGAKGRERVIAHHRLPDRIARLQAFLGTCAAQPSSLRP